MAAKRNPVAGMGVKELAAKKRAANPGRKTAKKSARTVALVGSGGSRNLAAQKPKKREVFPRYMVEEQSPGSVWMPRASFHDQDDAEQFARAVHSAQPSWSVRVTDTRGK